MAGWTVAHHTLKVTLLTLDVREGTTFSIGKLRWLSGSRYVHYGQSLSVRRPFNRVKKRRGLPSTMLVLPKASFSVESLAQHFPDDWQSISKVFENDVSGAAELLSDTIPSHPNAQNIAEGFLHDFSAIPIEITVVAVAAIVGSTLGYLVAALPTSKKEKVQNKGSHNLEPLGGEWLLVTKSTPFNRFVMMRCPTIEFENDNAQEGLSKRLSAEGHNAVKLSNHNTDRSDTKDANGLGKNNDSKEAVEGDGSFVQISPKQIEDFTPSYQRDFLHTEDGGVLAVDWPSHLELSGEHGLDTTLLLISGSVGGSGDKHVRDLVKKLFKCGYFPIVLNPRGCGGSLLTTPRLFTAGDSDDVRTAVEFVLKSRPWATIMAVGWGYGANMLVKYLGEETSPTPVTAAVCVDSIFNMEEWNSLNGEDHNSFSCEKIMSEFVQMLKSNQLVFQGKREFDVQKGLTATSLRDFDEAISMVSKGYHDVQEFYKDSSSKSWINNIKIPVFYIQGNESIGKTISDSPYLFEENPFTTLLFQLTRKRKLAFQTTTTEFYDTMIIEWLAAVEMAFLKGRHPLLQSLDWAFQPQAKEGLARQLPQSLPKGGELRMRNTTLLTGIRRGGSFSENNSSVDNREGNLQDWKRKYGSEMNVPDQESKALLSTSKDMYGVKEENLNREGDSESGKDSHESSDDESGDDESEVEEGQVRQATESIMKVLDVTMPGTLSEKQKEEVLEAVGRGESIVTALQEACPEDVREKMTTAVSAAVQARGMSLKLAGFGKSMPAPKIPDGMVQSIQEKLSSMVPNKLPAVFTNGAAKTSLPDNSAGNSNDVVGHTDPTKISGQNEGQKTLVQESSDNQQSASSASTLHADHNGNGAVMEQVHKAGSEGEQRAATQGQGRETDTHNNSPLESKASEQEKGDSKAKPATDDSRTNQGDTMQAQKQADPIPHDDQKGEGKNQKQESVGAAPQAAENPQIAKKKDSTIQAENQGDPLPHEDQKHEGEDQKQESLGPAQQTAESPQIEKKNDSTVQADQKGPGQDQKQETVGAAPQTAETPQVEKKPDSTTNSEDLNKKSPDPNVGESSTPQTQAPAAPALPSIDVGRAFEALTGVDDSTQMAVTNVFGVIENVIEKLEKEKGHNEQPSLPKHQSSNSQTSHKESASEITTHNRKEEAASEQPALPKHQSSASEMSRNKSASGVITHGQKEEALEQPSLPKDQSSSLQVSHNKIASGIVTQNQSLQDKPPTNDEFGHQQIPKTGNDVTKRELDQASIQTNTNEKSNKMSEKNAHNSPGRFPTATTALKNDSILDMDQDLDHTDLALEYFEDENVWKFIDGMPNARVVSGSQDNARTETLQDHLHTGNTNLDRPTDMETSQIIIPDHMIVDDELKHPEIQTSFSAVNFDDMHSNFASENSVSDDSGRTSICLRKTMQELVIDALEIELLRRAGNSILDATLRQDVEKVGFAVAQKAERSMQFRQRSFTDKSTAESTSEDTPVQVSGRAEKIHVKAVISAINEVYGNTAKLPNLLPPGVLFGVVLAALSPLDIISTDDAHDPRELVEIQNRNYGFADSDINGSCRPSEKPFLTEESQEIAENGGSSEVDSGQKKELDSGLSPKDTKISGDTDTFKSDLVDNHSAERARSTNNKMMGAVAAAMGASAALASHKPSSENISNPSEHEQQKGNPQATPNAVGRFSSAIGGDALVDGDSKASIVSTLAEKAMSVATPVVPTKEDGGVDHERLVEILAGLGQKGGILRFVGKIALLWGGLRGAMSLTDRLLGFLHVAERPLYQRILGFLGMAVLLWSPVLVPLLPALLQQWASQSQNGVASTAALIGLYGAVVILITIWGRKIRGYEDPLQQYGVSIEPAFSARQVLSLMSGLTLGLSLVASVYLLGVSFHMIQIDWAPAISFSSSNTVLANLASGWRFFRLLVQCFGISLAVSFVEELFFRSWLQEEISADLGFHRATALSGLAFSISQWSLPIMPGLWLLSLVLTGAKVRCNGDLSLVIGLHAGLMAGAQLISIGGQVKYGENAPLWFISQRSGDPFTGVIGLSVLAVLALLVYPWGHHEEEDED